MSKYIDADILREKIAEQMEALPREVGRGTGTITSKGYGMMQAFQIMRSIIDTLQQEQPEGLHFTPLNRLIQKIPSKNWNDTVNNYAKKLRDCLITEGYRKDAEVLQGYISYMNGNVVELGKMLNARKKK